MVRVQFNAGLAGDAVRSLCRELGLPSPWDVLASPWDGLASGSDWRTELIFRRWQDANAFRVLLGKDLSDGTEITYVDPAVIPEEEITA